MKDIVNWGGQPPALKPWQKHIHDGGTCITNFHSKQRFQYERAILEFGCPELSCGLPMLPLRPGEGCMGLHSSTGNFPSHITEFWRIFERLGAKA